jgi:hypothetical protein
MIWSFMISRRFVAFCAVSTRPHFVANATIPPIRPL